MKQLRFIQIDANDHSLFALDGDGQVWQYVQGIDYLGLGITTDPHWKPLSMKRANT